jgi:hypothetical protein
VEEQEVVVRLGGLPRPATVIERRGDQLRVRFRQAGGYDERWVDAADVVEVEGSTRPPYLKIAGLAVLAVLGLLLVLWPGGSDRPLVGPTPTPTPSSSR